ncbi:MAG: trypco2 family protein [Candidatus Tectimicrobiota bacterium]
MSEAPIRLTELIAELRRELAEAQTQGQGLSPRLRIDEAEIELQVVLSRENNAGAGVKFWVLNAELKDKYSDATTQKIKLKLKPTTDDDKDFTIAAPETPAQANPASRHVGMRATE